MKVKKERWGLDYEIVKNMCFLEGGGFLGGLKKRITLE